MKLANVSIARTVCQRAGWHWAVVASGALLIMHPLLNGAHAQDSRVRAELLNKVMPRLEAARVWDGFPLLGDPKRAALGITMTDAHRSDTLGVLVAEVTAGSPADKAGIKEGARITAINGVSLRLSKEDAADPELDGLGQRRLQRELAKVSPGDEIELRVATGSSVQTLQVKTVSAADLTATRMNSGPYVRTSAGADKRASLGVSIGGSGSARDTLGLFISSVVTDGPAEKAGVFEGDRISAINGVDVRVPREDSEDPQASMARVNRFTRELAKLAPGDKVTLRVYGGGRYREVSVTVGSSADVRSNGFLFNFGDGPSMMSLPRGRMVAPPAGSVRKVSPAINRRSALQ